MIMQENYDENMEIKHITFPVYEIEDNGRKL